MSDIFKDVDGQSEEQLQQKCVFWFHNEYPELRGCLFHVPNGGARTGREGAKFKKIGVYPGVSDLILLYNQEAILFELKDNKGRQSKKQKEWEETMRKQGFSYVLIRKLSDFKKSIKATIEEMV